MLWSAKQDAITCNRSLPTSWGRQGKTYLGPWTHVPWNHSPRRWDSDLYSETDSPHEALPDHIHISCFTADKVWTLQISRWFGKKLCLGWTLNTQKSQATGWWQAGLEALTISQGFQATAVNVVRDYTVRGTWDTFEIHFMHKSPNWITFSVIWKRTCVYLFGTLGHWFCRTKCYRSELHTQNKPLTAEKNWADFLHRTLLKNSSKQCKGNLDSTRFFAYVCDHGENFCRDLKFLTMK